MLVGWSWEEFISGIFASLLSHGQAQSQANLWLSACLKTFVAVAVVAVGYYIDRRMKRREGGTRVQSDGDGDGEGGDDDRVYISVGVDGGHSMQGSGGRRGGARGPQPQDGKSDPDRDSLASPLL